MKILFIAATIGTTCAAPAGAQTAVILFGIADAGLVRETGGVNGSINKISSGVGSVSRVGLRGSEDLGEGWSANVMLEMGAKIDTGESDVAGSIFNRQAYVGLKSSAWGAFTMGRQYTPYYLTLGGVADPFGAAYAGNIKNLFPTAGSLTRTSNTVIYASPAAHGVSAELAYSFGEQAGSASAGRQFGAALAYAAGALNVRLGYNSRNNDLTAAAGAALTPATAASNRDIGSNTVLAANYNMGAIKLYGAIGRDKGPNSAPLPNASNPYGGVKPTASTDGAALLLGAAIQAGSGTILTSYVNKDDRSAFNQDAIQIGVGYSYPLSKRTNWYAAYARISNKRGAGYTVGNNGDAGSGNAACNLGMRHVF